MSQRSEQFNEQELRERLSPLQYHVTQEAGTERAFTGETWDQKGPGIYRCIVCGDDLFSSETKYESGSGWPSFWEPLSESAVETEIDNSMDGSGRSCLSIMRCHLGHIFPDGPQPTGDRYCTNSASMQFIPDEEDA